MRVLAGTSGYSYKEWKGTFYPTDLPASAMLRFYGERFPTVEINNTFYQMPSEKALAHWSAEVPETFTFVLKASRRITHDRKLNDAADSVEFFLKNAAVLGAKLGPVLFQLPPFFRKDVARLRDFLALLPRERRAALEFRHTSWLDDEVYDVLRAHGAALCVADTDESDATPLVVTAPWGYLRLRRQDYDDESLRAWAERVRAQPWEEAFVFFKHEDEGKGPRFAAGFIQLLA